VKDLPESEACLYQFLKEYAKDDVLDFKEFERYVSVSDQRAKAFNKGLSRYRKTVERKTKSMNFFSSKGYTRSFVVGLIMILAGFLTRIYILAFPTQDMVVESMIYFALYIFTGSVLLFLPKEIFGKWSKKGLTFYHKWSNFENFVNDMTMLKNHPPESTVLWEEYLVYATALGCADTVVDSLKQVIPEQKWQEMNGHMDMYRAYDKQMGYLMNSIIRSANFKLIESNTKTIMEILYMAAKTTGSNYKGGGRGSSGGIGGGSSSGGGGAL
jgi:uncharacterized membrane protein